MYLFLKDLFIIAVHQTPDFIQYFYKHEPKCKYIYICGKVLFHAFHWRVCGVCPTAGAACRRCFAASPLFQTDLQFWEHFSCLEHCVSVATLLVKSGMHTALYECEVKASEFYIKITDTKITLHDVKKIKLTVRKINKNTFVKVSVCVCFTCTHHVAPLKTKTLKHDLINENAKSPHSL